MLKPDCCLWKVDSANLLQKYVPVTAGSEDSGGLKDLVRKIVYRNASAVSST